MEAILNGIASALGAVMDVCYSVCKNYGLAIILFSLISKLVACKSLRRPGCHC